MSQVYLAADPSLPHLLLLAGPLDRPCTWSAPAPLCLGLSVEPVQHLALPAVFKYCGTAALVGDDAACAGVTLA